MRFIDLEEIPSWFDLKKYSDTRLLTLLQWHHNLELRKYYWAGLGELRRENDCYREFLVASGTVIDWAKPLISHRIPAKSCAPLPPDVIRGRVASKEPTVRPITVGEIAELFADAKQERSKFAKTLRRVADQVYQGRETSFPKSIYRLDETPEELLEDFDPEYYESIDYLHADLDDVSIESAYVYLDLCAPDSQLVSDFRSFLKIARKKYSISTKTEFTAADMRDWADFQLLPYIDLVIWAEENQGRISDHVMGEVLFPDELEVDVAEKTRKVVRKKVSWIMQSHVLDAIGSQAYRDSSPA